MLKVGYSSKGGDRLGQFDFLVVGAGITGSVIAQQLAGKHGKKVLVIDTRPHFGGLLYDYYDTNGILVHKYGPHIFHTSDEKVWEYVNKFALWREYRHRVMSNVNGKLVTFPINIDTVNLLLNTNQNNDTIRNYLEKKMVKFEEVKNAEQYIVSLVGYELYDLLYKGYTQKQWGCSPDKLYPEVFARIPVRYNNEDGYFDDFYQGVPSEGYTAFINNLLSHKNIKVQLLTKYKDVVGTVSCNYIVYTGPIDEYFNYKYGILQYRSLKFKHLYFQRDQFQPVAVVNYPGKQKYTRITEYKHITGQKVSGTSICIEYPECTGEPYYPVPIPQQKMIYDLYAKLAETLGNITFTGRLGSYKYINIDQAIMRALKCVEKIAENV